MPSLNPPALVPEPVLQGTSARSSDPERPLLGPAVLRPSCPHTPHARGGCVESCPVAGSPLVSGVLDSGAGCLAPGVPGALSCPGLHSRSLGSVRESLP